VVLFTRDLRLHDNPALDLACRSAAGVIPVFVSDPALLRAPGRVAFLLDCLAGLQAGLRQRGGDLLVRHGDPVAEAIRVGRSHQAEQIIMAADVSRYARQRYQRLAAVCQQHRLALREVGSLSVVPPGAIVPSGGDHYRVFTPYWRAWSACHWRQPLPASEHVAIPPALTPAYCPRRKMPFADCWPRRCRAAARQRHAAAWPAGSMPTWQVTPAAMTTSQDGCGWSGEGSRSDLA
jgi:deoxyribodipyrimidine photo-lyase